MSDAPDLPDGPFPSDDDPGPDDAPRFERPDPTAGLNPVQLEAVTHTEAPARPAC